MTAALLAAVLAPLLAPAVKGRAHVLSSADVYRAQLAELERDRDAGRVREEEYLSARAESGRRLIKASASAEVSADGPQAARVVRPSVS